MDRQKKHNKHIINYLNWYLNLDNPKFAVMIKGKWGSGKTYFIQKYQEEKPEEKFINISLNGITTIKEIDQQLFCQIYPLLNNRLIGPLINLGSKVFAEKFGITESLAELDPRKFIDFDDVKYVFIFDDFERHCFEKPHTLMGYINSFIEKNKRHVILLSNEDEFFKNDDVQYGRIKEKVIGQTLTIDTPVKHVFDCLLTDLSKNTKLEQSISVLQSNYDDVLEVILKSGYKNFRVLRQTIQNFARIYALIGHEYFENQMFVKKFVKLFFALEIEHRMGTLNEDVFEAISSASYIPVLGFGDKNSDKDETQNEKIASEIIKKYNISTLFDNWIFEFSIWEKWLFDCNVDKETIKNGLNESYFFKEETYITKMINWEDLTDIDFETVINDIIDNLKEKKITNPSDIFLIYNRFINFKEHGYDFSRSFDKSIQEFFSEYIFSLSKQHKLEEDYSFIHQGFEPIGDIEAYKRFRSDLIDLTQRKTIEKDKEKAKMFLTIMKDNPKEAGEMIFNIDDEQTKQPKRLFKFIDAKEFIDRFYEMDNKNKRIIYINIQERYKFLPHKDWLLEEKVFVENAITHIQSKIKNVTFSPTVSHLEYLLKVLKDSLEKMDASKNNKIKQ
jgi:hypothetical protein